MTTVSHNDRALCSAPADDTATNLPIPHTAPRYGSGCRCLDCREKHRLQNRELRQRKRNEGLGDVALRASAISVVGIGVDEASEVVSNWSAARLRRVVLILADLIDPETPISRFGRDA